MRFQPRFFLVLALVATICTLLPWTVDPQTRAADAAPASGDAVIVWNANAGVAATRPASRRSPTPSMNHGSTP
jgi:hypothetical protein